MCELGVLYWGFKKLQRIFLEARRHLCHSDTSYGLEKIFVASIESYIFNFLKNFLKD